MASNFQFKFSKQDKFQFNYTKKDSSDSDEDKADLSQNGGQEESQNEEKEIPEDVKMKIAAMSSKEKEMFELMVDLIGPPFRDWPMNTQRQFVGKNIDNFSRFALAGFCFSNRLNPEMLYDWAEMRGLFRDAEAWRQVK